jgi:hypothetical protein
MTLPYPQQTAPCAYPEPDEFRRRSPILLLEDQRFRNDFAFFLNAKRQIFKFTLVFSELCELKMKLFTVSI